MRKLYFVMKRLFDIISSAMALIVLSPVFLIAIAGILVSDFGPVFYMAERAGKDNRLFRMYKFRSMRVDKNADEKNFKADVSRIFPFGAFMRKTKIDELPQLINVFIGDMSVIGPRPAAKDQVALVRSEEYAEAALVRPGLSGPAALYDYIYGDSVEDEEEYKEKVLPTRLCLEVEYVRRMSTGYDAKMIYYTVCAILYSVAGKSPQFIMDDILGGVSVSDTERECHRVSE